MNNTSNYSSLYGKGISFPPRVGSDGRVEWSMGPQNIRECIEIILSTELKERLMIPQFGCGLNEFLFEPNTVTTRRLIQENVKQAIEIWEPRIQINSIDVDPVQGLSNAIQITISYILMVTQAEEEISLTINLNG